MIAALNLQSVAQLSAEHILNCAAEGMIIVLLAWLLLRAVGRQNSGTRFAVWFAALLGIAALPLIGNWAAGGAELTKRSEITLPGAWALYISAAWLLMASAGLIRVGIGFWHLHRLRKGCVPVDVAALSPILRKTLEEFDSSRAVKLCTSDQLRVPTAIGFMKPLVVIPAWTMRDLSTPELNTILLHELAHLRRRDDWTNLVQKILGALLFFHPAVWWIEKKLALEREMACDDLVLAEATSPRAYAECLVAMAEKTCLRRRSALAQAAVDRLRHVSLRVSQILDVNRSECHTGVETGAGPGDWRVVGLPGGVVTCTHPAGVVRQHRRSLVAYESDPIWRFCDECDGVHGCARGSRKASDATERRPTERGPTGECSAGRQEFRSHNREVRGQEPVQKDAQA